MKAKHLRQRIISCLALADLSPCVRRSFGCVAIDPDSNVILSEGYNGYLRGGPSLCGGTSCHRDGIESGTSLEEGCIHAEQNAIYNAARLGVSLVGSWFIVNGEPCKLCAKAIAQVGASHVICIEGIYANSEGLDILREAKVKVSTIPDADDLEAIERIFAKPIILPKLRAVAADSPFGKPSDTLT